MSLSGHDFEYLRKQFSRKGQLFFLASPEIALLVPGEDTTSHRKRMDVWNEGKWLPSREKEIHFSLPLKTNTKTSNEVKMREDGIAGEKQHLRVSQLLSLFLPQKGHTSKPVDSFVSD